MNGEFLRSRPEALFGSFALKERRAAATLEVAICGGKFFDPGRVSSPGAVLSILAVSRAAGRAVVSTSARPTAE
jgi:hypothetical protein